MPIQNWADIIVQQLPDAQRKLGIIPAAFMPPGGLTGQVLGKNSAVNYDVAWLTILGPGGIYQVGNGLVLAGNTLHFAQAAAYTPGAIAFATGAATMGFNAASLFWDNTIHQLLITSATPLNPATATNYAVIGILSPTINANNANEFGGAVFHGDHSAGGGNLTFAALGQPYAAAGLVGVKGDAIVTGAVTVASMIATAGQNIIRSNATVTNAFGLFAVPFVNDVGINVTITNSYGVYVRGGTITGAGATIGTQYGVYIATMWPAGTRWGLYVQDTVAMNFFGGDVVFGAQNVLGPFGQSIETGVVSTITAGTYLWAVLTPLFSPAAASSASYQIIFAQGRNTGAQNFTGSTYGINLQTVHDSTGTGAAIYGGAFIAEKTGAAGAVTNAYGIWVRAQNDGGASITAAWGVFIDGSGTKAGNLGQYVGLFLGTPSGAGVITTNYGVYQQDASAQNFWAGISGMGIAASSSAWVVLAAPTTGRSSLRFTQGTEPVAPVDGDMWTSSTEKTLDFFLNGIERHVCGSIFDQTASQTIANTVVETTLFGTGSGTLTLPANFFVTGSTIFAEIRGHVETTGNPTARVRLYLGATLLLDTGALTLGALTGQEYFRASIKMTCRAPGAPGTIGCAMAVEYHRGAGSAPVDMLETIPAVVNVNTTGALALNLTWTWGTADPANSITSITGTVSSMQ